MQLSGKFKIVFPLFIGFLESALNFEYFDQKNEPHSLTISVVIESLRRVSLNA